MKGEIFMFTWQDAANLEWERNERIQEQKECYRPVCDNCGNYIYTDNYYIAGREYLCENCCREYDSDYLEELEDYSAHNVCKCCICKEDIIPAVRNGETFHAEAHWNFKAGKNIRIRLYHSDCIEKRNTENDMQEIAEMQMCAY